MTTKKNTTKVNTAEIITARFIDALKEDKIPWVKPWADWKSWSRNTGNDYTGVNELALGGGEYVTFKQAQAEGIKINKGAKAEKVVFYKDYKKVVTEEEAYKMIAEGLVKEKAVEFIGGGKAKVPARVLKYYNAFNVENCTDGEVKHIKDNPSFEWDPIEKAEEIAKAYITKSGIKVITASNQPLYRPMAHEIETGRPEQYKDPAEYYSTMFHELAHSTKHEAKRPLVNAGEKARAREELIAEIAAAYIMSFLGIESDFTVKNSNAYIQSWIKALEDDPNAILYAAPKAIQAAEIILAASKEEEPTKEEHKEEPENLEDFEPKTFNLKYDGGEMNLNICAYIENRNLTDAKALVNKVIKPARVYSDTLVEEIEQEVKTFRLFTQKTSDNQKQIDTIDKKCGRFLENLKKIA